MRVPRSNRCRLATSRERSLSRPHLATAKGPLRPPESRTDRSSRSILPAGWHPESPTAYQARRLKARIELRVPLREPLAAGVDEGVRSARTLGQKPKSLE